MTLKQKRELAALVIDQVSTLIEYWEDYTHKNPVLREVRSEEAAQAVANWLGGLPGDTWSIFLPQPRRR